MSAAPATRGSDALKWSAAIFSSRETEATLMFSIAAAATAVADVDAVIDVIINGNPLVADEVGHRIAEDGKFLGNRPLIRVWSIGIADKSNALNQYIHDIWPQSAIAFFIDGYAQVAPDALIHIENGLADTPKAPAGSGVATMGRSAKVLRKGGWAHGNLYGIRGDVLAELCRVGFRLPLGLYRTDGALFSVLSFNLKPADHEWDPNRVLVVPQATWVFRPLRWWNPRDLLIHIKRMMRQAQGDLENLAVREHLAVQKRPPQDLPRTTLELVRSWIEMFPAAAERAYLRNPLCLMAAWRLLRGRTDWSKAEIPPRLVSQNVTKSMA